MHNKTGADIGVRADVGTVSRGRAGLSYAVIANWSGGDADLPGLVLRRMNAIGAALQSTLEGE
jgi:beta-lactamase class A